MGHDGPVVGCSKNVAIFSKDCKGKGYELVLDNSDMALQLVDYLKEHFDIPYLGYADQTREAVNAEYAGKGWPKL